MRRIAMPAACLAAGCLYLDSPPAAFAADDPPSSMASPGAEAMPHHPSMASSMPAHGHAPDPIGIGSASTTSCRRVC